LIVEVGNSKFEIRKSKLEKRRDEKRIKKSDATAEGQRAQRKAGRGENTAKERVTQLALET